MVPLQVETHPLLDVAAFSAHYPETLGSLRTPDSLMDLLSVEADSPFEEFEDAKQRVRDLLRHGGYKPTGRGKPASEYLVRAVGENKLGSINLAVDACNVVSLHSRLPISVVDLDRTDGQLSVKPAPADSSYVFNQAGQEIKLDGLLCLFDSHGPCANGVKDSQRTKTSAETVRTLSIIWGTCQIPGRASEAARWYKQLLEESGVTVTDAGLSA